jgi:hypothetical protein
LYHTHSLDFCSLCLDRQTSQLEITSENAL